MDVASLGLATCDGKERQVFRLTRAFNKLLENWTHFMEVKCCVNNFRIMHFTKEGRTARFCLQAGDFFSSFLTSALAAAGDWTISYGRNNLGFTDFVGSCGGGRAEIDPSNFWGLVERCLRMDYSLASKNSCQFAETHLRPCAFCSG